MNGQTISYNPRKRGKSQHYAIILCGVQKIYRWFSRDDGTLTYRLESETSQNPRDSWSTQSDEEK